MARMMPERDVVAQMRDESLKRLAIASLARKKLAFASMSEEEQMLSLAAPNISAMYSSRKVTRPRDAVARDYLTETYGPKFADRVLANDVYRKMISLPPLPRGGAHIGSKG